MNSSPQRPLIRFDEKGAVAVEFAFILPVIMILVVMCTDFALSLLSQNQVEAAADAAAQFVLVNGWDGTSAGRQAIASAGTSAFSSPSSYSSPLLAPPTIDPVADIIFECADGTSGTYTVSGSYSTTNACATSGGVPYATITAHGVYTPFFAAWWVGILTNNALNLSASVTTRFQ